MLAADRGVLRIHSREPVSPGVILAETMAVETLEIGSGMPSLRTAVKPSGRRTQVQQHKEPRPRLRAARGSRPAAKPATTSC